MSRGEPAVAEIADLVTELLVPLAQGDDAKVQALLERYQGACDPWPGGSSSIGPAQDRHDLPPVAAVDNRQSLADAGTVYPGRGPRQHMWASMVVREHPGVATGRPPSPRAGRAAGGARGWPGSGLVTHEFFGAASAEQAAAALAALGDAEAHLWSPPATS